MAGSLHHHQKDRRHRIQCLNAWLTKETPSVLYYYAAWMALAYLCLCLGWGETMEEISNIIPWCKTMDGTMLDVSVDLSPQQVHDLHTLWPKFQDILNEQWQNNTYTQAKYSLFACCCTKPRMHTVTQLVSLNGIIEGLSSATLLMSVNYCRFNTVSAMTTLCCTSMS